MMEITLYIILVSVLAITFIVRGEQIKELQEKVDKSKEDTERLRDELGDYQTLFNQLLTQLDKKIETVSTERYNPYFGFPMFDRRKKIVDVSEAEKTAKKLREQASELERDKHDSY